MIPALIIVPLTGALGQAAPFTALYLDKPAVRRPVAMEVYCRPAPPPIADLIASSAFVDGKWTEIDPVKAAALARATGELHAFLGVVADYADKALTGSAPARRQAKACALDLMSAWAKGGALLGEVSEPQGGYERKWALVSLALSYQKLFPKTEMAAPPPEIASWFRAMTDRMTPRYPLDAPTQNNHYYWAAAAAMAVGVVLGDDALYDWGRVRFRRGLEAIGPDGFLPLELQRGQLAWHYHSFAAWPLTLCAAFEAGNGRPLEGDDKAALDRLVGRVLTGLSDPTDIEKAAGAPQRLQGPLTGRYLGWLEIYNSISPNPLAQKWILGLRPMGHIWLGGDTTKAFGRNLKPGQPPRLMIGQ